MIYDVVTPLRNSVRIKINCVKYLAIGVASGNLSRYNEATRVLVCSRTQRPDRNISVVDKRMCSGTIIAMTILPIDPFSKLAIRGRQV